MEECCIPLKVLHQLAKRNKISTRGKPVDDIIEELIKKGFEEQIDYLDKEFRFAGTAKALTICRPEKKIPKFVETPEAFISNLISKNIINENQIGSVWNPSLDPNIQLCGLIQDGADVFIRMVEEKTTSRREGYQTIKRSYAYFTSAVIHFAEGLVELRCPYSYRKKYLGYIQKLLGYADSEQNEWIWLTEVSKEEAKRISELLSAQLTSTQIHIPSTVGSLRFNAANNVDLRHDSVFTNMRNAIQEHLALPTDEIMDETCSFLFKDPKTSIELDVVFEINIANGGFKFNSTVTETIIELILDAFVKVYIERLNQEMLEAKKQIAAGKGVS